MQPAGSRNDRRPPIFHDGRKNSRTIPRHPNQPVHARLRGWLVAHPLAALLLLGAFLRLLAAALALPQVRVATIALSLGDWRAHQANPGHTKVRTAEGFVLSAAAADGP